MDRSSCLQKFFKIGVLKHFLIFQRKTSLLGFLFFKVGGLKIVTLFKKKTSTQVFSCEYCEIFKKSYFYINTIGGCFCIVLIGYFSSFSSHASRVKRDCSCCYTWRHEHTVSFYIISKFKVLCFLDFLQGNDKFQQNIFCIFYFFIFHQSKALKSFFWRNIKNQI